MAHKYYAYLSINDTDGRSMNFTETPTITVWDGRAEEEIESPSPTLTNITTGLYSVDIELATKTDVLFKIVPHVDDEDDIADIKVIHEEYIETVETMGVGVKLDGTQGDVTFGQIKAITNKAGEGAIHAENTHADGIGNVNKGGVGQVNSGQISFGQVNGSATSIGQFNTGATKAQEGFDPAIKTGLAEKTDIPSVSDIATAVWSAVTRTLTSVSLTAQGVWEYISRTLTASPTDTSNLATKNDVESGIEEVIEAIDDKPVTPATDISGLATEANATTNKNAIVTAINNKPVTPVTDTSALAKSSELTPLAKSSELTSLAKTSDLTGLAEKTDIPVDYAKELTLQDVKDQTDQLTFTVPGSVDATAVVDTSVLATSAELELVADNVNEIKGKTDQLVFTVPGKVDTDAKIDVSELIDSLLEANIEGNLDLKSALRIVLAFASGVSEGGGSTTIKYKDLTGLADRIIWTVNKSGDRLTSNIDGSDVI